MGKVVIMPKLGYTQDEGELIEWYKAEGETVRKGEAFFEVQTDKTVIRVDATEDGTVLKLLAMKRIDRTGFVDETHSPSECGEVYARLARGGAFPVVQFDWSDVQ